MPRKSYVPKGGRAVKVDPAEFVRVWEQTRSVKETAARLGLSLPRVTYWRHRLLREGVPLSEPSGAQPARIAIDVESLLGEVAAARGVSVEEIRQESARVKAAQPPAARPDRRGAGLRRVGVARRLTRQPAMPA